MEHFNWLFVGKRHCALTLLNEAVFPVLLGELSPLLATDVGKAKVSVRQSPAWRGRVRWSVESLTPALTAHRLAPDPARFGFFGVTAEFPSLAVAWKRQESVQAYVSVENDGFHGRVASDGQCGLFVSLREDVHAAVGEAVATQALRRIAGLFDEVRVLFRRRPWWVYADVEKLPGATIGVGPGDDETALQDVAAWRATDKLYSKYYTHWTPLEL